jgi:hypothetical protein
MPGATVLNFLKFHSLELPVPVEPLLKLGFHRFIKRTLVPV